MAVPVACLQQSIECERVRIEGLRNRFVPPDGGYGWAVAFGAFLVQFWIAGLIKSYGVILMEIMQMYPDASASLASWIPAILTCICLVFCKFIHFRSFFLLIDTYLCFAVSFQID